MTSPIEKNLFNCLLKKGINPIVYRCIKYKKPKTKRKEPVTDTKLNISFMNKFPPFLICFMSYKYLFLIIQYITYFQKCYLYFPTIRFYLLESLLKPQLLQARQYFLIVSINHQEFLHLSHPYMFLKANLFVH